ncbi:MAG: Xaa-Pro peptidase family protein [Anaerolineae bacterium]
MATYSERMARFQALLRDKAELAFIPITTDLEYLTGVPRDIPNYGVTLHPGAWLEGAWVTGSRGPVIALPRMTAEFGGLGSIPGDVRVLGDWDDPSVLVADILKGFDLPANPRVAISDHAHAESAIHIQELLPGAIFVSATDILRELRTIKDADEIESMRRAGAVTEAAFADVIKQLKLGMTELDIISEIDYQMKRHGSLGPTFTTSLYNSGPNLPLLHGQRLATWKRELWSPVSVLTDFGAAFEGMCYDFGRTISFGEPPAEFQRVYDLVMASQKAGIAALKADVATCEMADAAARAVIEDAGYGEMFRHRLGHGIGKDVHEPPFLTQGNKTILREGMMFTVEPSIMQHNSFSSRVEDVVLVGPDGGIPLTTGFQSLIVVE